MNLQVIGRGAGWTTPSHAAWFASVALSLLSVGRVHAQYAVDFEAPTFNASPAGIPIAGQGGWFTPAVAGSLDGLVMTYAGNTFALPGNPSGGEQFLGGRSDGGASAVRAQREDILFATTSVICYDAAASYVGKGPSAQNLGSFSLQPDPNPAAPSIRSFIQLNTWTDPVMPTAWNAGYLAYDAAGVLFSGSGMSAGPEWQNLQIDHWYRFCTTVDFAQNRIISVSITDLATAATTTVAPEGWFLGGGAASELPIPSGVRFFVGGGAGNIMAWDNLVLGPPPCPCEWNADGILNSQDFYDFVNAFFAGEADFNGDGATTSKDFFAFIQCLFAGCV